jgi:hypothetical protein
VHDNQSFFLLFQLLHNGLSPRIIIDVLRQASKACVVRRQFAKATILIQEAVLLARETYGEHHLKVRKKFSIALKNAVTIFIRS